MSLDMPLSDLLQTLSVEDLENLRSTAERTIREKRESEIERAVEEIEAVIARYGLPIGEVISRIDARSERPAKWRHPERPELTWCGRGRRPSWLNEAIDEGVELAKMRA
ncbi:DNA-binding protein H-NS [Gemmobacter caeni]|jgi:DNA-binding protein H-NS|uniref:DNA-binding protein H-NS n=1 Tax=Gemmobacter caeni TaxID=589035 RepID=A0A2T6B8L7_9RHOB|nr:H-NS histone family protein [Gemmobacter caeni]PTX52415.1 DNA-binding protein H-NS [Gemmobacter caeni]TWJ02914.1 DNA-binding protein H-NS [Gemmobacter caeni]